MPIPSPRQRHQGGNDTQSGTSEAMFDHKKKVGGGTQVFPVRILVGVGCILLLFWLLFSSSADNDFYGIMLDAGSTGSRIHVYHFKSMDASNDVMELQSEVFSQLKPGLSSYATDPKKGAASLQPLLDIAMSTVPANKRRITPINLKATAGLRMLPGDQAQALLDEVAVLLKSYPFLYDIEDAVEIMEGTNEGKFAWITVNYLMGSVHKPTDQTFVVLDLGGGSTQIAMATATATDLNIQASVMGADLSMYIYSHLGLGLMAGRSALFSDGLAPSAPELKGDTIIRSPCVSGPVAYEYGPRSFRVEPSVDASFDTCLALARDIIRAKVAEAPMQPAIAANQPIFAMSYYFDRGINIGKIPPHAEEATMSPQDFTQAARQACGASNSDVERKYPTTDAKDVPFMCMDLCFITALLEDGFGIQSTATLKLAQKLPFNGEAIETQWPLGASLEELGEELAKLGM
eukprot:TRINITY_DN11307_c0_g2_i1.p3 TRINITY_DN11307_c0_g2~~TRINITY_DN11307_c0_g2_i1.p3  ORF type:complete len:461 (+),score=108.85 TRINITY_DN11307_c0_g2_i1:3851-5233(+)